MKIQEINSLSKEILFLELTKCCGSSIWVEKMISSMPFKNENDLFEKADISWFSCNKKDWLEAFSHHPEIGNINSFKKKYQSTKIAALQEQKGVDSASSNTLTELKKYNNLYKKKFGYIFIVCAAGKSAEEMLSLLKERINNDADCEIKIAMKQQNEITKIRLQKLLLNSKILNPKS